MLKEKTQFGDVLKVYYKMYGWKTIIMSVNEDELSDVKEWCSEAIFLNIDFTLGRSCDIQPHAL